MSTMFLRFFGIPQTVIRLGKIKGLSGVAVKVYVALMHESERNSSRELVRTVTQLRSLVGGSRNSHAKARTELIEAGLVKAEPYGPEGFVFSLCDPETGKPLPLHPTEKVIYVRKDAPRVGFDHIADSSAKTRKPPKIDGAGSSFAFGANAKEEPSLPRIPVRTASAEEVGELWANLAKDRTYEK
jgi:hypothetical protein